MDELFEINFDDAAIQDWWNGVVEMMAHKRAGTARGTIKTPHGEIFETSAAIVRAYYEWVYAVEWETGERDYSFEPFNTPIGRGLRIYHYATEEIFDATDYESW